MTRRDAILRIANGEEEDCETPRSGVKFFPNTLDVIQP